jgi:hypothetical protein
LEYKRKQQRRESSSSNNNKTNTKDTLLVMRLTLLSWLHSFLCCTIAALLLLSRGGVVLVSSLPLPDDAFTVVFISDLENQYRNHPVERSQYVLHYIRNLKFQNDLTFDGDDYSDVPIDPKLVLHGGDLSHMWGCGFSPFDSGIDCRSVEQEYQDIWQIIMGGGDVKTAATSNETKKTAGKDDDDHDDGIPLLSSYGNHDYRVRVGTGNANQWPDSSSIDRVAQTDIINRQSQDFTKLTYELAAELFDVTFQEFKPVSNDIGQSMFRAIYRDVQIVSFNCASSWQSYSITTSKNGSTTTGTTGSSTIVYEADAQLAALAASLDHNLTTIFFQHYPIADLIRNQQETIQLIQEFPRAVHFSGHRHVQQSTTYSTFIDYTAAYPHTWNGRRPGFYAMLISPSQGILQVKNLNIPGLADGEPCEPTVDSCGMCDSGFQKWYSQDEYRCGMEPPFAIGQECIPFASCYRCLNEEYSFWKSKASFACGAESSGGVT